MIELTSTTSPFEGKGGVTVDPARAYAVLDEIVPAFLERRHLYRYHHLEQAPQHVYRPIELTVGSVEHARWLFFAAMTDRREQSFMVYRGHRALWEKHADWLYNNPLARTVTPADIKPILAEQGFGMAGTAARIWGPNSTTLFTWLSGDPRKLYEGKSINQIVSEKRWLGLPGFGPKILSLLAMFLAEAEMITLPEDAFPIDVHVQRISLSTGIIKMKGATANTYLEQALRPLLTNIIQDRDWNMVDVAHALWLLGSRMCTNCSLHSLASSFCPAYSFCKGPFSSELYFSKGKWDPDAQSPTGDKRTVLLPDFAGSLYENL